MEAAQNVVAKSYNAGIVALGVVSTLLSTFMLVTFVFLWFSFGHVYKNVNRRARARIHVNGDREISLDNIQDPYDILTGASFGSQEGGLGQTDCHGRFYIALPSKSKYDFKKSHLNATIERGFVVPKDIDCKSLTLEPFKVCRDGDDYLIHPVTDCYYMYVTITFEQPPSE